MGKNMGEKWQVGGGSVTEKKKKKNSEDKEAQFASWKIICIMDWNHKALFWIIFEPADGTAYNCGAWIFKVVLKYDSLRSLLVIGGDNCSTSI